jgi:CheY-like chemotaxis protein
MAARIEANRAEKAADDEPKVGGVYLLLANSDPKESSVYRQTIMQHGHACDEVHSAEDCVRAFAARDYDLILLNLRPYQVTSFNAAKEIRRLERLFEEPRVPILLLSSDANEAKLTPAGAAFVDDMVAPPKCPATLRTLIEKARPARCISGSSHIPREPVQFARCLRACRKDGTETHTAIARLETLLQAVIADMWKALLVKDHAIAQHAGRQMDEAALKFGSARLRHLGHLATEIRSQTLLSLHGRELLRHLEEAQRDLKVWRALGLGQAAFHGGSSRGRKMTTTIRLRKTPVGRADIFSKTPS